MCCVSAHGLSFPTPPGHPGPVPSVSLLVLRLSPRRCTVYSCCTERWFDIPPVRHSPRALRCVSSALRADIRLALSDCCFISRAVRQPNKWQPALHARRHLSLRDKRHVSPSPIHLSSISYCCQGVDCHRSALTTAASREHGTSRSSTQQFFGSEVATFRTSRNDNGCYPPDE